jgi:molybdenum cofactor guanylyltransferase
MTESFGGAVLTGGASRRMGRDKALVEVDGVPMARRVANAIMAAGAQGVAAVGGDLAALAALGLRPVLDPYQGEGPLGGLVAALSEAVDPIVVVVACDLPHLTAEAVRSLVDAVDGHDVALARATRREPLCGAWRVATSLEQVRRAFLAGERAVHRALCDLDVVDVQVDAGVVANANCPGDLPPVASSPMPQPAHTWFPAPGTPPA